MIEFRVWFLLDFCFGWRHSSILGSHSRLYIGDLYAPETVLKAILLCTGRYVYAVADPAMQMMYLWCGEYICRILIASSLELILKLIAGAIEYVVQRKQAKQDRLIKQKSSCRESSVLQLPFYYHRHHCTLHISNYKTMIERERTSGLLAFSLAHHSFSVFVFHW